MNVFSNNPQNLIGRNTKMMLYNNIRKRPVIRPRLGMDRLLSSIYKDFIIPNRVFVVLVLCIGLYLLYRYLNKEEYQEEFSEEDEEKLLKMMEDQTAHLEQNEQQTMNPIYPLAKQQSNVAYPPGNFPINTGTEISMLNRNDFPQAPQEISLGDPNYDYSAVYSNPSRSSYTGTTNLYRNAVDTSIQNPLGFSNQFNTTTGDFVSGMADTNNNNVMAFDSILKNSEQNMVNGSQGSPYQDEPYVVPPYAN